MKKYVKPELYYENFELSHTIANCSPAMNHSKDSCTYDSGDFPFLNDGETVFSEGNCSYTLNEIGYEDYCIQTNTGVYVLFTS